MKAATLTTLLALLTTPLAAQQPKWLLAKGVGDSLTVLWERSAAARVEYVACVAAEVGADTVRVRLVTPLPQAGDSLNAAAEESLARCGTPAWAGTIHTHVRSTDDDAPAPRFSPGDRAVMSDWVGRWGRPGAFCVLYSDRGMHCEVYPPPGGP